MKKMMIAAAVVAMAGAVVAADGYDFTASVKTTKAKNGSQKTTYTVNLGLDAPGGTYWWDDLNWDDEKTAKKDVKALLKVWNTDKDAKVSADCPYTDFEDFLADIEFDGQKTKYNEKETYKGKEVWCYTFKFSVKDEDCYRVAGSQKLKGIVSIDACCNGTWEFVSAEGYLKDSLTNRGNADEITTVLLYRFGGVTPAKATKVEYVGTIGDFAAVNLDRYSDAYDGAFALAGQGAWDDKNGIIKNISGNIVGVLQNPDCESCCDYDAPAIVFECNTDDELISEYQGVPNGTAAFGTFSLKYNKKY